MVWNASGAERVKSYRVYQELEARLNEVLTKVTDLERQVAFKDDLIRRLAAEIAMGAKTSPPPLPAAGPIQEAATSGERLVTRPGAYAVVNDGTAEHDSPLGVAPPEQPSDPVLAHIPTPKRKVLKHP